MWNGKRGRYLHKQWLRSRLLQNRCSEGIGRDPWDFGRPCPSTTSFVASISVGAVISSVQDWRSYSSRRSLALRWWWTYLTIHHSDLLGSVCVCVCVSSGLAYLEMCYRNGQPYHPRSQDPEFHRRLRQARRGKRRSSTISLAVDAAWVGIISRSPPSPDATRH